MSPFEQFVVSNAIFAVPMCIGFFLITRVIRSPHVAHGLWVLVLLKLLTPPLASIPIPTIQRPPSVDEASGSPPTVRSGRDEANVARIEATTHPGSAEIAERALPASSKQTRSPTIAFPKMRILLLFVWLTGAVVVATNACWHIRRFNRLLSWASEIDDEWSSLAAELGRAMGLHRLPRLVCIDHPISPALWACSFSPAIVVPQRILSRMTHQERRAVIAHELAHYARCDHWIRWLELAVTAIYWWHPAMWYARHELRNAEEMCCDAFAIAHCPPASAPEYVSGLLTLMDLLDDRQAGLVSGMGSRSQLKKRIGLLAAREIPGSLGRSSRIMLCAAAVLLLPFQFALGQPEQAPPAQVERAEEPSPGPNYENKAKASSNASATLLRPGDVIEIQVASALPEWPIAGLFAVESEGGVSLGPHYGRVQVAGDPIEVAEKKIQQHLQNVLTAPKVMVKRPIEGGFQVEVPASPYRIGPEDILQIRANGLPDEPIDGLFRVESSGKVAIGASYGRIQVGNLTLEEAEQEIVKQLGVILRKPVVAVSHGDWLFKAQKGRGQSVASDRDNKAWRQQQLEFIKFLEQEFKRAQARAEFDAHSPYDTALAGFELELARGQLAAAEGNSGKMYQAYRKAKEFAEEGIAVAQSDYTEGLREFRDLLHMAQKKNQINALLSPVSPQPGAAE